MNKYKELFGVDISKDVFNVHGSTSRHQQYKNEEQALRDSSKSYQ
jgi:transposase